MAKEYPLDPVKVTPVETKHRKLSGTIPSEATVARIEKLRHYETLSMRGQLPILWDRAEGVQVFDEDGNMWLDFSSGVLVTNAGHGRKEIVEAIVNEAQKPLLTTYCFPNQPRIDLVEKLIQLAPEGLDKAFLLSTGSETTECALKLMRTHGRHIGGDAKSVIVSFDDAFHGRTLGAQMLGGMPGGKAWIKNLDPEIIHVPFPDGFRNEDAGFELFEKTLAGLGVDPEYVAGVISETYQGVGPNFMPIAYAQALRGWCDRHQALLCYDEVQAGFGRCGRQWGFELYDVTPDLFCMGKGIGSSLPISAIIGRNAVMELYGPNEMTSTHTGNPLCCAAALANIKIIKNENLADNAANLGSILKTELQKMKKWFSDHIGFAPAEGLVGGLLMVHPGSKDPNYELAWETIRNCFYQGLLLFSPVGVGGGCVKIAPPLCIDEEALREGCDVLAQAVEQAIKSAVPC